MQSVHQEEDGDLAGAEASLRQANVVSRYFTPALESCFAFYYRQGNRAEFLRWAKAALSVGNGPPESIFLMAQRLDIPSDQIVNILLPEDLPTGQTLISNSCSAKTKSTSSMAPPLN